MKARSIPAASTIRHFGYESPSNLVVWEGSPRISKAFFIILSKELDLVSRRVPQIKEKANNGFLLYSNFGIGRIRRMINHTVGQ